MSDESRNSFLITQFPDKIMPMQPFYKNLFTYHDSNKK